MVERVEDIEKEENNTVNDALKITEELNKLQEEKEKQIQEKLEKQTTTKQRQDDALIGHVEDINEKLDTYTGDDVEIIVEVVDEGEVKKLTFGFNIPSKTEYSVDNEFVRLLLYFSDKEMDVTGLINREIWVKKVNGNYELDIPETTSRTRFTYKKIRRFLVRKGLADWDGIKGPTKDITNISIGLSSIGISIMLFSRYFSEVGFTTLAPDTIISSLIVPFIFAFLLMGKEIIFSRKTALTSFVLGSFFTTLIYVFNLSLTHGSELGEEVSSTVQNSFHIFTIIFLLLASLILLLPYIKSFILSGIRKGKQIRRSYRKRKGVEYVKD